MMEILTVIAVMAILMSVAAVGIQKIDRGQATTSALAISEALFDEARSAATGRGSRARIYVHNEFNDGDDDDRQRYRRFLAVAVYDFESKSWEFLSSGLMLPSGVYFDPEQSKDAALSIPDLGTYGEANIRLPGKKGPSKKCFYYEFNSEGICVDGERRGALPGAVFVLIGGVRATGQEEARIQGNNQAGFVIWRNGRTSIYRSPDQIAY